MKNLCLKCLILLVVCSTSAVCAMLPKDPDPDEVAGQIVARTNSFRKEHKLSPLSADEQLTAAARDFAKFMASSGKYGHQADGRQPFERAERHGYEYCVVLENIAFKYESAGIGQEELIRFFVESWKNSPRHRKNMLDPDITHTGVAVADRGKGYYYAVQMFGRPKSAMVTFEIANRADIPLEYKVGEESLTLLPQRIREQDLCQDVSVVVKLKGVKAPKTITPANGDRFEYRKGSKGVYSFTRAK